MAEEKGYWFSTENGTHIHAEEGESKEQAMGKKFKSFKKEKSSLNFPKPTKEEHQETLDKEIKDSFKNREEGLRYLESQTNDWSDEEKESLKKRIDRVYPENKNDNPLKAESRSMINDKQANDPRVLADKLDDKEEVKEEFKETVDYKDNEDTNFELAEKNEKINGAKAKSKDRKDKYGNPLVSDEAFNIGVKAGKSYLEESLKYNSMDSLKRSNVFLHYMQSIVSNAIINNGYDPNLDVTYTDLNEIIGNVVGEEVDLEANESDRTKGWTGKKYSGYSPKGNDLEKESPLDSLYKKSKEKGLFFERMLLNDIIDNPDKYNEFTLGNRQYKRNGKAFDMYEDGRHIWTGTYSSVADSVNDYYEKNHKD